MNRNEEQGQPINPHKTPHDSTLTHYYLMLEEEPEITFSEFLLGALTLSHGGVENEPFHFLQSDDFFFH